MPGAWRWFLFSQFWNRLCIVFKAYTVAQEIQPSLPNLSGFVSFTKRLFQYSWYHWQVSDLMKKHWLPRSSIFHNIFIAHSFFLFFRQETPFQNSFETDPRGPETGDPGTGEPAAGAGEVSHGAGLDPGERAETPLPGAGRHPGSVRDQDHGTRELVRKMTEKSILTAI